MYQKWTSKPIELKILLFPVGWQTITRYDIVGDQIQDNKHCHLGYYVIETNTLKMADDASKFFLKEGTRKRRFTAKHFDKLMYRLLP